MTANKWREKERAPEEFGKKFPEFSHITKELLWQRNLRAQKDIDEFFNPDYTDLHDPFLLRNGKKAVQRIFKALKKNERVMVYGDYDSDGVNGAVIMYRSLLAIGFSRRNLGAYLPDREREGYGLNTGAVEQFVKEKYNLIITIDCGTTSFDAINLANKNKIDTIVLDHHKVIDKPPAAYAFINPHQKGEKYPFKDLSGAAVAFKIASALYEESRNRRQDPPSRKASEGEEKWLLDAAAVSTITDVMPLLGENRTIVKYGLFVLAQAKRPGYKALMDVAGVKPTFRDDAISTNLSTYTVGFMLGPRINAAGRMDHANTAFALLNAESYEEATVFARQLDERNRERQALVEGIIKEVEERIRNSQLKKGGSDPLGSPIIFEGDKSWSIGVAGIVAGRIADKYYRPTFIYKVKDNGTAAGSVRTISGFNVVRALESASDLLINFGGHPEAGGFTVSLENVEEMKGRMEKFARKNLKEEDFIKSREYSLEVAPAEISWQIYEEIKRFEPFGEANREPIFLLSGANIVNIEKVGNGSTRSASSGQVSPSRGGNGHLRFFLDVEGKRFKAMGFRMGDKFDSVQRGDKIDVLFALAIDEWNGNRELMLRLADFRKSEVGLYESKNS